MNDLPKEMTESEAFGYADVFKFVTLMPEKIQKGRKWTITIKMKLRECKSYFLPKKKQKGGVKNDFTLNSKQLSETIEQKFLGLTVAIKLSWQPNVDKRFNKAWKSFYFR